MRKKLLIVSVVVLAVVAGTAVWLSAAAPSIGEVAANPAYVVVNTPADVLFTAYILDPSVIPTGVNLLQVDESGKAIRTVGAMRDNATNGDAVAGDKIFSMRVPLNRSVVGQEHYRVSAAFKGVMRRVLSPNIVVYLDPLPLPPDPGEAGKQTIEGIDSDSDGIRDDIQRYIALDMHDNIPLRSALIQLARAEQEVMFLDGRTSDPILVEVSGKQERAIACLLFRSENPILALQQQHGLRKQLVNTDSRAETYMQANSLFGGQFVVPPVPSDSACDR